MENININEVRNLSNILKKIHQNYNKLYISKIKIKLENFNKDYYKYTC